MDINIRTTFPYLQIKESILNRYKHIRDCYVRHNINYKAYQELLESREKIRDNQSAYFSLMIRPNSDYLWNVIYAIVEDFIYVYCFETYNEYSEPKEYVAVQSYGQDYRYCLDAIYKIDKETVNKFKLLSSNGLSPDAIFKLLHTDKTISFT